MKAQFFCQANIVESKLRVQRKSVPFDAFMRMLERFLSNSQLIRAEEKLFLLGIWLTREEKIITLKA
jgi:hypothetical protein